MFLKIKHVEFSGLVGLLNWTDLMGDTIIGQLGKMVLFGVDVGFSTCFGFALSLNFIERPFLPIL